MSFNFPARTINYTRAIVLSIRTWPPLQFPNDTIHIPHHLYTIGDCMSTIWNSINHQTNSIKNVV